VANADVMRTWQQQADRPMQFISFCFALGGVLGPLYTQPYLAVPPVSHADVTPMKSNFTDVITSPNVIIPTSESSVHLQTLLLPAAMIPTLGSVDVTTVGSSSDVTTVSGGDDVTGKTSVHYAFAFTALAMLLCAVHYLMSLVTVGVRFLF
jgi:hypothetical protein